LCKVNTNRTTPPPKQKGSNMNTNEIEALLQYIEFQLLAFVEETENHVKDGDVIDNMYARAHEMLGDLEQTLDTQYCIRVMEEFHRNKDSS
jgi:hypothetical protein